MSIETGIPIYNKSIESPYQDYVCKQRRQQDHGLIAHVTEPKIVYHQFDLREYRKDVELEQRTTVNDRSVARNGVHNSTGGISCPGGKQSYLDSREIVMEQCQESYGRWNSSEHEKFMKGLELYGKDWRKIQTLVTTRTLVQIRTHAQKLFKKINQFKTSLKYEKYCVDKRRSITFKMHPTRSRDIRSDSPLTVASKLASSIFDASKNNSFSESENEINPDEENESKSILLFPKPIRANTNSVEDTPQPYFLLPRRQQEYFESQSPETNSLSQEKIRAPEADYFIPANGSTEGAYINSDTYANKSNSLSTGTAAVLKAIPPEDHRACQKYPDMTSNLQARKYLKLTSPCDASQKKNRNQPESSFFSKNELAEEERDIFQREMNQIFNTAVSAGHNVMINYSQQSEMYMFRERRLHTQLSLLTENEERETRLMLLQEKNEIRSLSSRLRMQCEQQINQINRIIKEQHAIIFRLQLIENGLDEE